LKRSDLGWSLTFSRVATLSRRYIDEVPTAFMCA